MFSFFNSINWLRKLILFGFFSLLIACQGNKKDIVSLQGSTMGTTYSIKVVGSVIETQNLQYEIDQRLSDINAIFSTYIASSEVSRINQSADRRLFVSEEFKFLIHLSRQVYDLSAGAFDITVGPLVNLWGFGPNGPSNGVPDLKDIQSAMSRTGFHRLHLADGELERPVSMYLDFSAIAKGYAVDEIAGLIEASGADSYLVEIGGEVKAKGRNLRGKYWVIGVEAPDRKDRLLHSTLPLADLALATSGDYRNYFEHQGQIFSHSIDPRIGWPVKHTLSSVTVLHESAAMADALATAFSVLGLEAALDIAEEENLMVFAIIRDENNGYEELSSRALSRYLEVLEKQ